MHSFSELVGQFEERFTSVIAPAAQPQSLYEPIRYFLELGGKRVRPVLCLMASELFGQIPDDAWQAANAIEVFHNFTLVHDDIMDKAPLRRGKQTVHTKYGLTSGILGGDAMCILAYASLANIRQPLQPILDVFNRTALEVCEGQQLDMDFELRDDVSVSDYVNMIGLKTSVLLAGSLKIGALLAGATVHAADKLYQFGKALGIAFQLQDDYLDAFGAPEKTGKQPGGDIQANKKTYLYLKALEQGSNEQKMELERLETISGEEKVQAVLQVFEQTGAGVQCREAVQEYSNRAFDCLDSVPVLAAQKQPLFELASYLLQRDY